MKLCAVILAALLAAPAAAQGLEAPMTIEGQTVVMRDALALCRLTLDERVEHAHRNGYSYQQAVLLGNACRLIDDVRQEAAAARPVANVARAAPSAVRQSGAAASGNLK
jgi:hypothetical protein